MAAAVGILIASALAGCGKTAAETAEDPTGPAGSPQASDATTVPYAISPEITFGDQTISTAAHGTLQSVGGVRGGGFIYSAWSGTNRSGTTDEERPQSMAHVVHVAEDGSESTVLTDRAAGIPISKPASPLVAWTEYTPSGMGLTVWNAETGATTKTALPATDTEARATAVAEDEVVTVASIAPGSGQDPASTIWQLDGDELRPSDTVPRFVIDMTPRHIVTTDFDGGTRVSDRATEDTVTELGESYFAALSPDDTQLASINAQGLVTINLTNDDTQQLTSTDPAVPFALAWVDNQRLTATTLNQDEQASVLDCEGSDCTTVVEPTPAEGGIPVGTQFLGQFWSAHAGS